MGGLAGLRLFDVLDGDIRARALMDRIRGVGESPAVVRFFSVAVSGFVLAIRRSEVLGRAMQSRGFGGPVPRTHYRVSPWRRSDSALVWGGVAVGAMAIAVALMTGEYRAVFG